MTGRKPLGQRTQMINSLGFVLFGYDQGVMSGIITAPAFNDLFTATKENSTMQGFVTAIYEIGTTLSSLKLSNVPFTYASLMKSNTMPCPYPVSHILLSLSLREEYCLSSLDWANDNEDNAQLCCCRSSLECASAETVFYFVNFVMFSS